MTETKTRRIHVLMIDRATVEASRSDIGASLTLNLLISTWQMAYGDGNLTVQADGALYLSAETIG